MSPFSIFSSVHLSQRIESLREAELNLLEYAKTRFSPSSSSHHSRDGVTSSSVHDGSNHEFEIMDTPIVPPSVVSSRGKSDVVGDGGCLPGSSNSKECDGVAPCQLFPHPNEDSSAGAASSTATSNASSYRMHGIKVTNKRLSSAIGNDDDDDATLPNNLSTSTTMNRQSKQSRPPAPLVLLHGYANGSLYFYRNFMQLSHYHFPTIYALDMLGWGLSSRPNFDPVLVYNGDDKNTQNSNNGETNNNDAKNRCNTSSNGKDANNSQVLSAENFFVESLESWRKHHDLPRLTLAGHSMGGYLSVAYAERYPQHVERLILLSPVGVPEKKPEDDMKLSSYPLYVRAMIKTVRWLFDKGITPGSFLRSLPLSRSKQMVDGYILNRLPAITCEEERGVLSQYLYQNSMLPGSGEYCLSAILTAGAFARVPLVNRIPELTQVGGVVDSSIGNSSSGSSSSRQEKITNNGDSVGDSTTDNDGMEVHFIYGENDWMDYKGGLEVQRLCWKKRLEWKQMREQRVQAEKQQVNDGISNSQEDLPAPPPKVFVHGVRNAGHLLMLDNYEEFNAALIIAAGGEEKLPPNFPRPVEFVCQDELDANGSAGRSGVTPNGFAKREILSGEDASMFFRGGRFNRQEQTKVNIDSEDGGAGMEEKKMEEQLA